MISLPLPGAEKRLTVCAFVSTQYVMDRQTERQTDEQKVGESV